MGQAIDYAALAKQAGATSSAPAPVDYTALAKQAGAVSSTPAAVQHQPTTAETLTTGAKDLAVGALKGAGSTADAIGKVLVPDWLVKKMGATPPSDAKTASYFAPDNTTQAVGKGVEQAAEFLVPGGAEEELGRAIATKFPKLAKVGTALLAHPNPELNAVGKIVMSALAAGTVNKAQGGTFTGGAAAGAAGGGIAEGLKKVAPALAETALRIRATDRSYGATPGRAVLDLTKGTSPGKVAESARDALTAIDADRKQLLSGAVNPVDLGSTKQIAQDFLARAREEGHPGTVKDITKLASQLEDDLTNGRQLPRYVFPPRAAALNRGVSNAITSWNPATANDTMNAAGKMMHHELGEAIAAQVPEVRPLNQATQSLFPVVQRGTAVELNAPIEQRLAGRLQAHTGALTGAGIGGWTGYEKGGVPGAVAGAAAGFVLPEVLSSPEMQMAAARAANKASATGTVRAVQGAASQVSRTGEAKWADLGAAKLSDHIAQTGDSAGITQDDIEALQSTPQGRKLLMIASDYTPGTKQMINLVKQVQTILPEQQQPQ